MGRRARGEGTLYRETDPRRYTRWCAEKTVVLPNQRVRIKVRARTQDEALAKLRRKEDALRLANPSADRMTLSFYLDKWLAFMRPQVKESSIREYARAMRHVKDRIGDVKLARVTPADVQLVMDELVAEGRAATANAVRRYLKGALRQAERWDLLRQNPVRNLRPVRRDARAGVAWEPEQVRAFLRAVERTAFYPIFYAAVFTGLRIGELQALRWSDVTESEVRVVRTFARYAVGRESSPKSMAGARVVPIAAATYEVIRSARRPGSPLAFPSGAGTMMGYSNVRRALQEGVDRANAAGESVPMVTLHDLRRTAATLWALQGAPPKVIQAMLGHSTPHLALSVYTKVYDRQVREAALDPTAVLGGSASGGRGGRRDTVDSDDAP